MDGMKFDSVARIEIDVEIERRPYKLCSADEEAACDYRDSMMVGAQMEGRKMTRMGALSRAEPILVSKCLFEVGGDGGRRLVPIKTIYHWPSAMVKKLFKWIQDNSDLRETPDTPMEIRKQIAELQALLDDMEAGEDPAKNVQSDTETSSE